MTAAFPDKLLRGLSIYQDIVLAGETVRQGERDCAARWRAIAPLLQDAGSVLDIGSNFGWFGLQICAANPRAVVASVEADLRSAAVQRVVLESHVGGAARAELAEHKQLRSKQAASSTESMRAAGSTDCGHRICLLTAKAGAPLVECFAAAGPKLNAARFDAALCLNVLHWVRDHQAFMQGLGSITGKIIVEHPDPDEAGAGVEAIRRQIGPIGPYLRELFADRPVERIAFTESHRDQTRPRELWLVGPPAGWPDEPQPGIDAAALLELSPAWPPRSWWNRELDQMGIDEISVLMRKGALFTSAGLALVDWRGWPPFVVGYLRGLADRVPEKGAASSLRQFKFHARQLVGNALRWAGLRD